MRRTNDAKIDSMERKIEQLQVNKVKSQRSTQRDQEETIKCLKEHITQLEHTNFQNEISAVNMSNMTSLTKEMESTHAQKRSEAEKRDHLW